MTSFVLTNRVQYSVSITIFFIVFGSKVNAITCWSRASYRKCLNRKSDVKSFFCHKKSTLVTILYHTIFLPGIVTVVIFVVVEVVLAVDGVVVVATINDI